MWPTCHPKANPPLLEVERNSFKNKTLECWVDGSPEPPKEGHSQRRANLTG